MIILYNVGIFLYSFFAKIVSPFLKKARDFTSGRKNLIKHIREQVHSDTPIIWIHCSSVGEFEQARPLIERHHQSDSSTKILLTFFSPSGYNLRKDYPFADWIFYLPMDTRKNAIDFIDAVKPEKVFFIKYDFWYNYLSQLKKREIDTYLISAIFRKEQSFFKWYGGFYRSFLKNFTKIFVQDVSSKELLEKIDVKNVVVSGDTRFDRVHQIMESNTSENVVVKTFVDDTFTWVAGSTWERDEQMIAQAFDSLPKSKLIIAPHVVEKMRIASLKVCFHKKKVLKYTDFAKYGDDLPQTAITKLEAADVLIIDCIGILSTIYKYGKFAYIGGGFGVGIHNILEAATYGCPIIFGPNYQRFKEACDMVRIGGANSYSTCDKLIEDLSRLIGDEQLYNNTCAICKDYVNANIGATDRILKEI